MTKKNATEVVKKEKKKVTVGSALLPFVIWKSLCNGDTFCISVFKLCLFEQLMNYSWKR